MRLKTMDGPIGVRNANNDIINSPKRINTLQNSNIATTNYTNSTLNFSNSTGTFTNPTENFKENLTNSTEHFTNSTEHFTNSTLNYDTDNSNNTINNVIAELQNSADLNILNNVVQDKLQWCQASLQEAQKNANNCRRNLVNVNINNTLAATFRHRQRQAVAAPPHQKNLTNSICSLQSTPDPDDTFPDFEEAQQSCSSTDTSPQDEDRCFDISDSESSEDGNLSNRGTVQRRPKGIVNPNYPGFQHLAHTLTSDVEYTDDELDLESPVSTDIRNSITAKLEAEANNNNNLEEIVTDYKIDSVNRLNSVENIQKVFYDKTVFNIEEDSEFNQNSDSCSGNSNHSDEDSDAQVNLNIRIEDKTLPIENIVGDFRGEIEAELGKVSFQQEATIESPYEFPKIEKAIVQELEEAVEKLQFIKDLSPTAIKYNIEPNIEQPFNKLSPVKILPLHQVLEDTTIIQKSSPFDKNIVKECSKALSLNLNLNPSENKRSQETSNEETNGASSPEDSPIFEGSTTPPLSICLKNCQTAVIRKILLDSETPFVDVDDSNSDEILLDHSQPKSEEENEMIEMEENFKMDNLGVKIEDAFLSNGKEKICFPEFKENILMDKNLNIEDDKMEVENPLKKKDSNRELEELECQIKKIKSDTHITENDVEKFCKEDITKDYREKEDDSSVPRKKEKMEAHMKKRKDYSQQTGSLITFPRREGGARSRDTLNRRSVPIAREKKKSNTEALGSFDVYNIETAMPKIDLEAIECHLRAAREEERRRRTDREEIRRRLAMGSEDDYYSDRPGRKPSLQSRLQSGMNLQICFMNESLSDTDSPSSDSECPMTNPKQHKSNNNSLNVTAKIDKSPQVPATRPATLSLGQQPSHLIKEPLQEMDFFARQARLQTEARMALAQAKEMAKMQMEIEKQRQKKSPITEMIRTSMEKVGIPFPEDKRRLSRQILTDMNVAQLQVIVNDLHTQIEGLNESLVKFLMARDDLHMEQDSMLVDIEDLTRYLGAKEQVKDQNLAPTRNNNTPPSPAPSSPLQALNSTVKPHLHRIASLVKK